MLFSLIVPVYNRPDEVDELLASLAKQSYKEPYEIVIIEDGSGIPCREIIGKYATSLSVSYYYKENTGPGDSRNFGMGQARGSYFIILDSDCILPPEYLTTVAKNLEAEFVDCFGGPDAALDSFTDTQKAINFSMTSFLTTGGVRGKSEKIEKFQPRSFNMGLSAEAFKASGGFGNIHPGEDPDLSIRLWKLGYKTRLFSDAYVYHKRRIDWQKFFIQVNKFGKARPILDLWHPGYKKATFLFPSLFILGFAFAIVLFLVGIPFAVYCYLAYIFVVFAVSTWQAKNLKVGFLSIVAVMIQFYGYGTGYLESFFRIYIAKETPQKAFPNLFFKK
jgi:glycosyltransferase involved in cell wall biosynthesis